MDKVEIEKVISENKKVGTEKLCPLFYLTKDYLTGGYPIIYPILPVI